MFSLKIIVVIFILTLCIFFILIFNKKDLKRLFIKTASYVIVLSLSLVPTVCNSQMRVIGRIATDMVLDKLDKGRITLKPVNERLEGYAYTSFSGGCKFAGKELYAFRAASGHFTVTNNYGTILFYERVKSTFRRVLVNLNYDSSKYGELRDPNLSVSRDGTRLYVTCFTAYSSDRTGIHHSIIFILNKELQQIGTIIVPDTVFWGNALETPKGYLLHADYGGNEINIYRSTETINKLNDNEVKNIKMFKILTLKGQRDRKFAEPTIGYYDDKLVLLARSGGKLPAVCSLTYNLEGVGDWKELSDMEYIIHAPCLQPYSSGQYLVYSGSIINANITGGGMRKRMPYVGLIDFSNGTAKSVSGVLTDNKYTWGNNGYGGYTTLVKIDEDNYGVMYYNDTSKEETLMESLYFKIVNVRELLKTDKI